MIRNLLTGLMLVFLFQACTDQSSRHSTLQFIHFWTEPQQQLLIDSLISEFEDLNPTIKIDQVPVQWSEGKTKLLLAHASGNPPDITHIGIEWTQEFIDNGIFLPLNVHDSIPSQCLEHVKGKDGRMYCQPWTLNTRALIITHDAFLNDDTVTWDDILASLNEQHLIGMNSTEPHNVTKKYLPILWAYGSRLFQKLPFSSTCDSTLIDGFILLKKLLANARIDQSRRLDEFLVNRSITLGITGQWILSQLKNTPHRVLPRMPGKNGASILSGDCLGISVSTKYPKEAKAFVNFITKYGRVKQFCSRLQDIGLPAHENAWKDPSFHSNADQSNFTMQCLNSIMLPSPSYYLDAEEILEDHIMRFIYGNIDEQAVCSSLKMQLQLLEGKQKKGS